MPINFGNTLIDRLYLGSTEIQKAYFGDALIYDKSEEVITTIDFVASSATVYNSSGTTINLTIPATVQVGDLLVAAIFTRSALTIPAGWTLVRSHFIAEAVTQHLMICSRIAQAGDAGSSVSWVQDVSNRMAGDISAFRASNGQPLVFKNSEVFSEVTSTTNRQTQKIPDLTAGAQGPLMGIAATTGIYALTAPSTTTITPPDGFTLTTVAAFADNRLGAAYKAVTPSELISGAFTTDLSSGVQAYASITATIGL